MKRFATVLTIVAAMAAAGCSQPKPGLEVQTGSDVTVQKKDGVKIVGRLVEVKPEHVVIESREGARTTLARADIATLRAETAVPVSDRRVDGAVGSTGTATPAADPDKPAANGEANPQAKARDREYREVTIPAGTILPLELQSAVSSDTSNVEDPVRATLRRSVTVGGVQALPAGTAVVGHVTAAERSARVKGRARVAFRFTSVDPPGDAQRVAIRTDAVSRLAPATKKQDAAKIGGGAAGGAIVGGILGGGDGAAKGAAIGGAAGTGVVLSTRGKEVRLGRGAMVSARLAAPVTLRVPVR